MLLSTPQRPLPMTVHAKAHVQATTKASPLDRGVLWLRGTKDRASPFARWEAEDTACDPGPLKGISPRGCGYVDDHKRVQFRRRIRTLFLLSTERSCKAVPR